MKWIPKQQSQTAKVISNLPDELLIKVYNDDCINILPTIDNNSIDLIIADPPYGNVLNEKWDVEITKNYTEFTNRWILECKRVLKESGSLYIWASIGSKSIEYWLTLINIIKKNMYFKDLVIWSKQRGRGNTIGWLSTREEMFWVVKDNKKYFWNKEFQFSTAKYDESWIKRLNRQENPYKRATNVWTDIDEVSIEIVKKGGDKTNRKNLHPTQKPINAMKRLILAHTLPGQIVLDPFSGSGTIAVACKELNRKCIAIEKEKQYYDIINERLNSM